MSVVSECVHGMGDPAWCRICREATVSSAVPRVLPTTAVDDVTVGAATATRESNWEPSSVVLQNSTATDGTEVTRWHVTFRDALHEMDLEFYRARDSVMEIQLRFREGPERFIGLHRRHRLGVRRHTKGWWSSLRNQSVYRDEQPDRCARRSPSLQQLSQGALIEDAGVLLESAGGAIVRRDALGGTKRGGSGLVVLGSAENQAPHIAAFLVSRVLPVYNRYEG